MHKPRLAPAALPLLTAFVLAACLPPKGDLGDFTDSASDTDEEGDSMSSAATSTGGSSSTTAGITATTSDSGTTTVGTSTSTSTGPDTSSTGTSSTGTTTEGTTSAGTTSTSTGPDPITTTGTTTDTSSTGTTTVGTSTSTSTGPDTTTTTGGQDLYPACGAPSDAHQIKAASIEGDTLHLDIEFSGGCEVHTFDLCFGGIVLDIGDVILGVVHDANNDICKALITEPHAFDLKPLQVFASPVTIQLEGWKNSLQYTF